MANQPTALEQLRSELRHIEERRRAVVTAIQSLEKVESANGLSTGPSDEYAGMKIAEAVAKYLRKVGRSARLAAEVLPALHRGGCNLGAQEKRYYTNAKIAVRMNSKPRHQLSWDEKTDTVSLRPGAAKVTRA